MLSIIGSIGSAIVGGVSDYFKGKQEIKKIQLEADKTFNISSVFVFDI